MIWIALLSIGVSIPIYKIHQKVRKYKKLFYFLFLTVNLFGAFTLADEVMPLFFGAGEMDIYKRIVRFLIIVIINWISFLLIMKKEEKPAYRQSS